MRKQSGKRKIGQKPKKNWLLREFAIEKDQSWLYNSSMYCDMCK